MNISPVQLNAVFDVAKVHSATQFTWFGKLSDPLPPALSDAISAEVARSHLLTELSRRLYQAFYCLGSPVASPPEETVQGAGGDPDFVAKLAAANGSTGSWMGGWTVLGVGKEEAVVQRAGLRLLAPFAQLRTAGDGFQVGDVVELQFPKHQFGISPGHYMVLSNHEDDFQGESDRVRVYWHLDPAGAAELVAAITQHLGRLGVPYRFKLLNDPGQYSRCDAAVLYLCKSDYAAAAPAIEKVYRRVASWMRAATPAFTKPLAAGIAVAEDPPGPESFGLYRTRLLADAILCAHEAGGETFEEKLATLEARFAEEGLSLKTSHLNADSQDIYPVFASAQAECAAVEPKRTTPNSQTADSHNKHEVTDGSRCLEAVNYVADQLCRDALWHQDRCNWIGSVLPSNHEDGLRASLETLGPTVYHGTAGIAIFLAETAHITGDLRQRDTAIAAVRQALARLQDIPEANATGLHSGRMGVALAAARVGKLFDVASLCHAAKQVADAQIRNTVAQEFDILSGMAGGVLANVTLARWMGDDGFLTLAKRLGDNLVRKAECNCHGCSWRSLTQPRNQRNLLGYSHGASGVAHALLELATATGESKYLATAKSAIAYERNNFSHAANNWPDFRVDERRGKADRNERRYMCAWCHGAAGVAVSRLRAWQLLGDNDCRDEANVAMQTTRNTVQRWLDSTVHEFSLCHGLAGNADLLMSADRSLAGGKQSTLEHDQQHAVAARLVERCLHDPAAVKQGRGLLVGQTGLGHFLLRHAVPEVPSVLTLLAA